MTSKTTQYYVMFLEHGADYMKPGLFVKPNRRGYAEFECRNFQEALDTYRELLVDNAPKLSVEHSMSGELTRFMFGDLLHFKTPAWFVWIGSSIVSPIALALEMHNPKSWNPPDAVIVRRDIKNLNAYESFVQLARDYREEVGRAKHLALPYVGNEKLSVLQEKQEQKQNLEAESKIEEFWGCSNTSKLTSMECLNADVKTIQNKVEAIRREINPKLLRELCSESMSNAVDLLSLLDAATYLSDEYVSVLEQIELNIGI